MPQDNPENTTGKYYPPKHDEMVQFARQLGNTLGEGFTDHEIVYGLADFMAAIARTLANNLNRKAQRGAPKKFDKNAD